MKHSSWFLEGGRGLGLLGMLPLFPESILWVAFIIRVLSKSLYLWIAVSVLEVELSAPSRGGDEWKLFLNGNGDFLNRPLRKKYLQYK